jgi:DNA-binding winged helix-turn-helix (wHTH) protein
VDFANLSPKQKKVATYMYERRGQVITFTELLSECWSEYGGLTKRDRTLVHKLVAKIRQKLGEHCIHTTRDRSGYIWIGDGVNSELTKGREKNGYGIKETILSSERAIDGAVTLARLVSNGDEFILQLQQAKGTRAQTVNLDGKEWLNLQGFVALNSVVSLKEGQ